MFYNELLYCKKYRIVHEYDSLNKLFYWFRDKRIKFFKKLRKKNIFFLRDRLLNVSKKYLFSFSKNKYFFDRFFLCYAGLMKPGFIVSFRYSYRSVGNKMLTNLKEKRGINLRNKASKFLEKLNFGFFSKISICDYDNFVNIENSYIYIF